MDKVFIFLMLTFSISMLLYFGGYTGENNSVSLIFSILQGEFASNPLWVKILAIFTIVGGLVVIGGAIAGNASAAITSGSILMAGFLVSYISDIVNVIKKAGENCQVDSSGFCGVVYYLILFILAPLALGFAYSLYQFAMGGND